MMSSAAVNGRVVGATAGTSSSAFNVHYVLDALGRRIATQQLDSSGNMISAPTRFFYDDSGHDIEERDANGNVTAQYVWNPIDRSLIARDPGGQASQRQYALTQPDGTVTAVTDAGGNVQERHHLDYDPITGEGTLQLVERDAHEATFAHSGGTSQYWAYRK